MKFSDEAWALWQTKFLGVERATEEAAMANEQEAFLRKANGNEEKAMGLLALATARDLARTLHLNESFVLKGLIATAPRAKRSRLKKAIRLARGGH